MNWPSSHLAKRYIRELLKITQRDNRRDMGCFRGCNRIASPASIPVRASKWLDVSQLSRVVPRDECPQRGVEIWLGPAISLGRPALDRIQL
jgi:hypothetical protein